MIEDIWHLSRPPEHIMIGNYKLSFLCRVTVFLLVPPVVLLVARNRLDIFGRCALCVGVLSFLFAFVSWVGGNDNATAAFLLAAALGFGLISKR